MDNIDDDAKNAFSGDPADWPTSGVEGWFRIVWGGILWFILTSLIIWFWLREALPDPFRWWLWLAVVVPVVGMVLALIGAGWRRWAAKP